MTREHLEVKKWLPPRGEILQKSTLIFVDNSEDERADRPFQNRYPPEADDSSGEGYSSAAWSEHNSCVASNYPNEDDSGLGQMECKNSMVSAISYTILMPI